MAPRDRFWRFGFAPHPAGLSKALTRLAGWQLPLMGWPWHGLAPQQVFFLVGRIITNDDVEPYSHCVPEPAQRLDVGYAAAQLNAREGGLADPRSLGYLLLGEVPAPADGPKLVAESQVPAGLLVLGVLSHITGLREAGGLECLPPA